MRGDAIQIMKHNSDNDASLKPRFLPDTTVAHSPQPASPPPHTHPPFTDEAHVPISSLWGRARTELLGWVVSFPWAVLPQEKSLLFPADLGVSQSPQPRGFITRASLFQKGFKVRGLYISIPWSLCPESDCNNYSFSPARRGWCSADTFPQWLCCSRFEAGRIVRASQPPSAKELWMTHLEATKPFFSPSFLISGISNTMMPGARWPTECAKTFTIVFGLRNTWNKAVFLKFHIERPWGFEGPIDAA